MSDFGRCSQYEPLFGAWYLKKKIGQGAIGQVYEIQREDVGTVYRAALKVITVPESEADIKRALSSGVAVEDLPEYYRKLTLNIANEFKYLAKLKGNSYIVNYEDHQIIENLDEMRWDVLIKTELLTPLVEHVINHPLEEREVLKLGINICRALKYCSQYNILHRDIKPENIFISPSGDYKLGDFGIARIVEETYINLSRKGTYTYMAPEVFHGQKYDQSADLYSLGLVMYKYLNHGRIPFMPYYPEKIAYDDTEKAFSERMSGKTLTPPASGSSKLHRIILRACEYDPKDRYSSPDEMLEELEGLWLSENSRQRSKTEKKHHTKQSKSSHTYKLSNASDTQSSFGSVDAARTSAVPTIEKFEKPKANKWRRIAAVILLSVVLAGAGIYVSIPKEVTDITGIDDSISLYYDESIEPEYTIEPDWFKDERIGFSSSDEDVFKVSGSGKITAESIGQAELEMSVKEYTETVHVEIVPKVTSITDVEGSYDLYTGGTVQLAPTLSPKEFAKEPVTYKSSDESVATVDDDGMITAVSAGEAKISIAAGGSKASTVINVYTPVIAKSTSSGSSSRSSGSSSSKKSTSSKKSSGSKESFGDKEYF